MEQAIKRRSNHVIRFLLLCALATSFLPAADAECIGTTCAELRSNGAGSCDAGPASNEAFIAAEHELAGRLIVGAATRCYDVGTWDASSVGVVVVSDREDGARMAGAGWSSVGPFCSHYAFVHSDELTHFESVECPAGPPPRLGATLP